MTKSVFDNASGAMRETRADALSEPDFKVGHVIPQDVVSDWLLGLAKVQAGRVRNTVGGNDKIIPGVRAIGRRRV